MCSTVQIELDLFESNAIFNDFLDDYSDFGFQCTVLTKEKMKKRMLKACNQDLHSLKIIVLD